MRIQVLAACLTSLLLTVALVAAGPADAALGQREVLPNGVVLLVSEQPAVPIVTVSMILRAGAFLDPPDKPGVAYLVGEMLMQGTASRTAPQISEAIESVGGVLSVSAGAETGQVSLSVLREDLDLGLELLADVLLHPAFRQADLERKAKEVVAGIRRDQEDPGTVSSQAFMALAYGTHPFGRPAEGSLESVPRITRDDLVRFHAAYYRPGSAILAVVGAVEAADVKRRVMARLGGWQAGGTAVAVPPEPPPVAKRVVKTIQRQVTQANINLGHLSITRSSPDYYAVQVMNYLLGGAFNSYLVSAIREEKGWAYDVGSYVGAAKLAGDFSVSMQTKNEVAQDAIDLALEQIRRIKGSPVSAQELADAKAYLTGSFPLRLDTSGKIAGMLASIEYYGLGLDYVEQYARRISGVTAADVQRAAQKYLNEEAYALAVVADLTKAKIRP
jgi:zinc protease